MLLAILLPAVLACAPAGSPPAAEAPPTGIRPLTILHTNDLHARLLPDERGYGGFAHIATAIREEREDSDGALVLHAGDFVQGTPVSTLFKGLPVIEVANTLGVDVHTLGNHEFDYGWEQTKKFIEAAEFDTVSANVVDRQGNTLAPPYTIKTVNGVRIGVIGAVTEQLDNLTRAVFRGPWDAAPLVPAIRRAAQEIGDRADLIVVLAHCFDDEDDRMLAELPEVDLIVSGHNHGGAEDVKAVDGRLCVKVRSYGRELGRLDLEYDAGADRIVSYDWRRIDIVADDYAPNPATLALVRKWEAKVSEVVDEPIGRSTATLRKRELRPLIESVMRREAGADYAYMNEGGIRDSVYPGEVTRRHIWNMLPFGNHISYGRVRGRDFPSELRGIPGVDPNREYVIATNNFIGEKWAEQGIVLDQTGPILREALIEHIQAKRTIP